MQMPVSAIQMPSAEPTATREGIVMLGKKHVMKPPNNSRVLQMIRENQPGGRINYDLRPHDQGMRDCIYDGEVLQTGGTPGHIP